MDISEFAFRLLLLFLPGIICAFIVDELTTHRPRESFFFIMQAFVYGLMSYFLYWVVVKLLSIKFPAANNSFQFLQALTDSNAKFSFPEIFYVSACSIIVGLLLTFAVQRKILNHVARWMQVTNKFGDLDVWGYLMNNEKMEWITVRDHTNDLAYDGWVEAFSDDSKDAEILLRDVSVYVNSTSEPLYQVGAMYISRDRQDITIEYRTVPIDESIKWKEKDNAPPKPNSQ